MTSIVGLLLLALILIQIATVLLGVRSVLNWHVAVGLIMVPFAALKIGSTTWRMVSYYQRRKDFHQQGAPPMPLRLLGPILVVLTVTLLASGVVLIAGPSFAHSGALTVHKVSFYTWLVAVTAHVVPHLVQAVRFTGSDVSRRSDLVTANRNRRTAAVLTCLVTGGVIASIMISHAATYLHNYPRH